MTFDPNADISRGKVSRRGRTTGIAAGGVGLGAVAVFLIAQLFGVDLSGLVGGGSGGTQQIGTGDQAVSCETGAEANASVDCRMQGAAASLDTYWSDELPQLGGSYSSPQFVLFTEQTSTGCGGATSAVGPFYCPPDQTVYLDTSFYDELRSRFGATGGPLAQLYVPGSAMGGATPTKLDLPAEQGRSGLLTQAAFLAVQAHPDQTSPVLRGKWVLDNLLGSPPPPPPAVVPPFPDAEANGKVLSVRERLAEHRANAACASCHTRMDPLGLALENFNALGRWRDRERAGPIDASGTLITGEAFQDVRQLKRILVERHAADFYRCLTEKLMTYALGRSLEYYDMPTVRRIVADSAKDDYRFSSIVMNIVTSAPFMERQVPKDDGKKPVQTQASTTAKAN